MSIPTGTADKASCLPEINRKRYEALNVSAEGVKGDNSLDPFLYLTVPEESQAEPSPLTRGLRISDILRLRPCDIVLDGDRYRLEIVEQKTGKSRVFTVPLVIQQYIENYCLRNGIQRTDRIFPITERAVQKQLAIVCDYLGYEGISTHSFRKWYATEIYKANGFDIALVQRLLQHSSAAVTQRYIGIEPQRIEKAIEGHATLI